jgi:hypothetical protein
MEDQKTRRKIIREWMALPKDKRHSEEQVVAFGQKGDPARRVPSQSTRAGPSISTRSVPESHGVADRHEPTDRSYFRWGNCWACSGFLVARRGLRDDSGRACALAATRRLRYRFLGAGLRSCRADGPCRNSKDGSFRKRTAAEQDRSSWMDA